VAWLRVVLHGLGGGCVLRFGRAALHGYTILLQAARPWAGCPECYAN